MEFQTIVKARRSAMKFIKDIAISKEELENILHQVKYAPSAYNLQHTQYLIITDSDRKKELYEVADKQYKILTASAAILVLGDLNAYQSAGKLYEGMLNLGILDKQEYDHQVNSIVKFYESLGEQFMVEDAIRNASLSAMLFMLAAKDKGWDTCPMYTFYPDKLKEMFNVPNHLIPVLLITMGKEDTSNVRPRGYRKPIGEFVTYNSF